MKVSAIVLTLLVHQVVSDASTKSISHSSNEFSNRLYKELSKEPGNVLVCPLSLHLALGLVHQGAGGKTAQELASTLQINAANTDVKEEFKSIITGLQDNVLKIVTKLYPQVGYQLNSNYTNIAKQYFLSEIESLDYSDSVKASNTINKYVEDHTNNKIHDLIKPDSISELTRIILINAIHFDATWKNPFQTTYDDFFKVTPTEKVPAKMMSQTDYFGYKEDAALDAKILKMDYEKGYSMLIVLPNKEDGLPALEAKLVTTSLDSILNGLQSRKVEVTIPKFTIEKSMDLKNVLIKMGINDLFQPTADLKQIANGDNLYVSDVVQKTFINVHENGTEAAAATGSEIMLLFESSELSLKYFNANHPFHIILINDNTTTILFGGRLVTINDK